MSNTRKTIVWLFLVWSLIAIIGYIFKIDALRGLGLAYQVSPLPVVFSDVNGFETFSADFKIELQFVPSVDTTPSPTTYVIDPQFYSQLKGPYNRRNVYGAAISYGPRLPEKVWKSILKFGLCSHGPLARESEIQHEIGSATISVHSNTKGRNQVFLLSLDCQVSTSVLESP